MRAAGPVEREMAAFRDRVFSLMHYPRPVRIYTGCARCRHAAQGRSGYSAWEYLC
jgi:hypothetical protein